MPLDHLWATWRSAYVTGLSDTRGADGDESGRTLFERILDAAEHDGDDAALVVRRGPTCYVVLNLFPYSSGHLLVVPNRAVSDLEDLAAEEEIELWTTVRQAVAAQKAAFGCDGVNVGLNLGPAAGGSQSDHLHVHCVPRWIGDANFVSVTAETRVLPVSLVEAMHKLRAAWPV